MSETTLVALREYVDEHLQSWRGTAQDFRGVDITTPDGLSIHGYALDPTPDRRLPASFVEGLPQGWYCMPLTVLVDSEHDGVLTSNPYADGWCFDLLTTENVSIHDLEWVDDIDWGNTDTNLERDTSDDMTLMVLPDVLQGAMECGVSR